MHSKLSDFTILQAVDGIEDAIINTKISIENALIVVIVVVACTVISFAIWAHNKITK
jgi:hypothetical protein